MRINDVDELTTLENRWLIIVASAQVVSLQQDVSMAVELTISGTTLTVEIGLTVNEAMLC